MKNFLNHFITYCNIIVDLLTKISFHLEQLANQKTENDIYLDSADVKRLFRISDSTLFRWRKSGEIKFKKVRGKIYYSKASLDEKMRMP